MKGLKFIKTNFQQQFNNLGFNNIQILGKTLNKVIKTPEEDTYEYYLECFADGEYVEIDYDDFYILLGMGIYALYCTGDHR